jgi:hypothetical protein
LGLGQAAVDVSGVAFTGQRAVDDRLACLNGRVEPDPDAVGGSADRRRHQGARGRQQVACAVVGAAAGVDLAVQCLSPAALSSLTSRFYPGNPTIDNSICRR